MIMFWLQPGCTTLEDHIVRAIKEAEKEPCEQENLCSSKQSIKSIPFGMQKS